MFSAAGAEALINIGSRAQSQAILNGDFIILVMVLMVSSFFIKVSGGGSFLFGRKARLPIVLHAHDRPACRGGFVAVTAVARMVFVFIVVPALSTPPVSLAARLPPQMTARTA